MLTSLTATGVVASAAAWEPAISTPVLIIAGVLIILGVAAWALSKFGRGRRGKKK